MGLILQSALNKMSSRLKLKTNLEESGVHFDVITLFEESKTICATKYYSPNRDVR